MVSVATTDVKVMRVHLSPSGGSILRVVTRVAAVGMATVVGRSFLRLGLSNGGNRWGVSWSLGGNLGDRGGSRSSSWDSGNWDGSCVAFVEVNVSVTANGEGRDGGNSEGGEESESGLRRHVDDKLN